MAPIVACWNGHLSQSDMMVVGGIVALWVTGSVACLVNVVLIPLAHTNARSKLVHAGIFVAYVAPMVMLVTTKLGIAVGGITMVVFTVFVAPLSALVHLVWLLVARWQDRKQRPRLAQKPLEAYNGSRCVSCRAPISFGVHICPLCGYTQPEYEGTI